jgi:uncharacterized protein YdbL (DUF1318 family)
MRRMRTGAAVMGIVWAAFSGCLQTKSEVNVKPVDINLNITGRLELVITDARKEEQKITGSAPKRTVRPEDIGLPAESAPTSMAETGRRLANDRTQTPGLTLVAQIYPVADSANRKDQLIQQMSARHPQIAAMLDSRLVGEQRNGFLAARGSLSAQQQALMDAENADRAELYKIEAAAKGTSVDQVALAYYMARLEHVNKGNWVERYDKATATWNWFQWDR